VNPCATTVPVVQKGLPCKFQIVFGLFCNFLFVWCVVCFILNFCYS
jgi:hypothetical protein